VNETLFKNTDFEILDAWQAALKENKYALE
jgi:hypothetical protein